MEALSAAKTGRADINCSRLNLSWGWIRTMPFKMRVSLAERICFLAILSSAFSVTLRAQTSSEIDASMFSISTPAFSSCGRASDECSSDSTETSQSGSNQNNARAGNSRYENDWVHAWLRKVDKARASQPHFVSPIVTTHVMLVEQYRYDMSWQQDPTGGTITSNYGASRGLEIIPTTRLEVGIFPPG